MADENEQSRVLEWLQKSMQEMENCQRIAHLSQENPDLIASVAAADRDYTLSVLAGLTALPANQSKTPRLEALLHLVFIYAAGKRKPNRRTLHKWLNVTLGNSILTQIEDPPQDVAVSNVVTIQGNRRIFHGVWENPDFYLQRVTDILETAPSGFDSLKSECYALLRLSEEVAERLKVARFTAAPEKNGNDVFIPERPKQLVDLAHSMLFTPNDLATMGLDTIMLKPFLFDGANKTLLVSTSLDQSPLHEYPVFAVGDLYLLALPSDPASAIRMHILRRLHHLGGLNAFAARLWQADTHTISEALRFGSVAEDLTEQLPKSRDFPPKQLTQIAGRFDVSKAVHILLLHDNLEQMLQNGITTNVTPEFAEELALHITESALALASNGEYSGGLTLIVMGGLGRGFQMRLPDAISEKWSFQVWSMADLSRLFWRPQSWLLALWKMSMQVQMLEVAGIELDSNTGDVNLYGVWEHYGYRLLPLDSSDAQAVNYIQFGPDFTALFRQNARLAADVHAVFRPDRKTWEIARKQIERPYFSEVSEQRMYAIKASVEQGRLEGVVETASRAWWIDCVPCLGDVAQRDIQYRLWEMVNNWMVRLAPELETNIRELPPGNIIIQLDVSKFAEQTDWSLAAINALGIPSALSTCVIESKATIYFTPALLAAANVPENIAERIVVRAVTTAVFELSGLPKNDHRIEEIVSRTVTSKDARFFHVFSPQDARDLLAEFDHEQPRYMHEEDSAMAAFHIAIEAGHPVPGLITDEATCNAFLHDCVDAFWKRIQERLLEINRTSLINECLINIERLTKESDLWTRTARAVATVNRDRANILEASRLHDESISRSQIANRVIVEMGLSTCPLHNGRKLSSSDLYFLMAQVVWLIRAASLSDVVRSRFAEPNIIVSPFGEYSSPANFAEKILKPYQSGYFEDKFTSAVERYNSFFEVKEPRGKSEIEVFGNEFVSAFETEYGLCPQRLIDLVDILTVEAINQQTIIIQATEEAFRNLLLKARFTKEESDSFLAHFVLTPRARWDAASAPFRGKDWWPWRFRRRLSLLAQPVILLGGGQIVCSPAFCEDSFQHIIGGAFYGHFETEYFSSNEMKEYIGHINSERGHAFNQKVAAVFRTNGFEVRTEMQMSELNAPEHDASGDVDVFAWHGNKAFICECKNLLFARTIGEIAEQLKRFRGQDRDDLAKHLRRYRWIQANPNVLSKFTGQASFASLRSLLVTNTLVPMRFKNSLAVEVRTIKELPTFLKQS